MIKMKRFFLFTFIVLLISPIVLIGGFILIYLISAFFGPFYMKISLDDLSPKTQSAILENFPFFKTHIDKVEIYEDWPPVHGRFFYGRVQMDDGEIKTLENKWRYPDMNFGNHPEDFATELFNEGNLNLFAGFGGVHFFKVVDSPRQNFLYFSIYYPEILDIGEKVRSLEKEVAHERELKRLYEESTKQEKN